MQLPPASAQTGASGGVVASGVPASAGGGGTVPQAPSVAPVGLRHMSPWQQSATLAQVSPVPLHTTPASAGGGGGGGGATGVHVPVSWPMTSVQAPPAQQSPDDVQTPLRFTQVGPPSGVGAWQRSTPLPSGRQGVPPQHSDENVH
jgi:hypothetical protein